MNVTRIQSCYHVNVSRRTERRSDRTAEERFDVKDGCGDGYDTYCPSNLVESPIQPPWRVLPWPRGCEPVDVRKVTAMAALKSPLGSTDVNRVGRTLDVFV